MDKEEVFKIIEEYEKLGKETVRIKFSKEFEKKGLIFLLSYNHSFWKGTYSISKLVQRKLDKTKIEYELVE